MSNTQTTVTVEFTQGTKITTKTETTRAQEQNSEQLNGFETFMENNIYNAPVKTVKTVTTRKLSKFERMMQDAGLLKNIDQNDKNHSSQYKIQQILKAVQTDLEQNIEQYKTEPYMVMSLNILNNINNSLYEHIYDNC